MTYTEAKELFGTARSKESGKPLQNNTRLYERGGKFVTSYAVKLHDTDVVIIKQDNTYVLNSGGWRTPTTKDRINKYAPVKLYQNNHIWYIGSDIYFDGVVVDAKGKIISKTIDAVELEKKNIKVNKMVKKYIDGFVRHVEAGELETPSGGDCWMCSLFDTPDIQHLLDHFSEEYYVPSLFFNALNGQGYANPSLVYAMAMDQKEGSWVRRALRHYFMGKHQALLDAV